jgi:DNA-binding NarL/FixJ family response regulator
LRSGASGLVLKSASAAILVEALDRIVSGSLYVPPELELERVYLQPRRNETTDPVEALSSREYQVFQLLVDGLMRKLDIYDVAGLVKFAIHREMAGPGASA